MDAKQVANVLVKILGLSIFTNYTGSFIVELITHRIRISSLAMAASGFMLTVKSQIITAHLCRSLHSLIHSPFTIRKKIIFFSTPFIIFTTIYLCNRIKDANDLRVREYFSKRFPNLEILDFTYRTDGEYVKLTLKIIDEEKDMKLFEFLGIDKESDKFKIEMIFNNIKKWPNVNISDSDRHEYTAVYGRLLYDPYNVLGVVGNNIAYLELIKND